MKRIASLCLALCALQGCATSVRPYDGPFGVYSDVNLGGALTRVTFKGGPLMLPQSAHDLVLLRAAEIALQRGVPYFQSVYENLQISRGAAEFGATNSLNEVIVVRFFQKIPEERGVPYFDAADLVRRISAKYKTS